MKCKVDIVREGVEYVKGDIIDVPESNIDKWLSKGWGSLLEHKEQKQKKETKELKAEKETK